MKIAIMQPYIFPYLGYFQLINSVDKFIFYDDVNYIKGGWVNRNKILVNNKSFMFTIPLSNMSSFRTIKETEVNNILYTKWKKKFIKSLNQNYNKSPNYKSVIELIEKLLIENPDNIADFAINMIKGVSNYLDISTVFEKSSFLYTETKGLDKADRIIEICKINKSDTYINPSGGKTLYSKEYFKEKNIEIHFIENELTPYSQFILPFVNGLSIIDVLMFNTKDEVKKMLTEYKLI